MYACAVPRLAALWARVPPRLRRWLARWDNLAFLGFLVLYLAPLWLIACFPSQDGPSHVQNAAVLRHIGADYSYFHFQGSYAIPIAEHAACTTEDPTSRAFHAFALGRDAAWTALEDAICKANALNDLIYTEDGEIRSRVPAADVWLLADKIKELSSEIRCFENAKEPRITPPVLPFEKVHYEM